MSYLLALIGTRNPSEVDIEGTIEFHLRGRRAFWSGYRHDPWARYTPVVAQVVGVGVVVLTGRLDCTAPVLDPLIEHSRQWDWRYDMQWDPRPRFIVPAAELGPPFDRPILSAQSITRDDYVRAFRALHGRGPDRSLDGRLDYW